jgi:hypothetical protein
VDFTAGVGPAGVGVVVAAAAVSRAAVFPAAAAVLVGVAPEVAGSL